MGKIPSHDISAPLAVDASVIDGVAEIALRPTLRRPAALRTR
jgi:hypothetical protein